MAKRKASDSLAKLRSGITRETPATRAGQEGAPATGGREKRRGGEPERKVRVSVDLVRGDHKYLRDYAYDHESDAMSVMRALLAELKEDDELQQRVGRRLAAS